MSKRISWIIILFLLGVGLLPLLFSHFETSLYEKHLQNALMLPSFFHPFGTDALGRDVLWRSLYGASLSLWMGMIINIAGVFFGLLAGFLFFNLFGARGMLIIENLLAIPFFVLGGIFSILIGTTIPSLLFSFSLLFALPYAYMVQSYILTLKETFFFQRSLQIRKSFWYTCKAHAIPFIGARLSYQFWISIHSTIFALASMTFLGFGLKPPTPEWGSLIYAALPYFKVQPFFMLAPFLLFLILAWAIFHITLPQSHKSPLILPFLDISAFSHHYLIIHIDEPSSLSNSIRIGGENTLWTFLPQDYHQNFPDNFPIMVFIKDLIGKKRWQKEKPLFDTMLKELELPKDIWKLYPKELSGGMLQRLTLLIAKITQTPALLMGTPLASLNTPLKEKALAFLFHTFPRQTYFVFAPYWDLPSYFQKEFQPPLWFHDGHYHPYKEVEEIDLPGGQSPLPSPDILIKLEHPRICFSLPVLETQSITVYRREILGIVGPSGIGKTTLGKILAGFLPLEGGTYRVFLDSLRSDIVLQNPTQFNENMRILPLIEEFDLFHRLSPNSVQQDLLARFSLPCSFLKKTMKDLSKGEQYQILLLRSFLYKPQLLILDEFFDHVDPLQYNPTLSLLEELRTGDSQTSVVIISHKVPFLEKICDRMIELQK